MVLVVGILTNLDFNLNLFGNLDRWNFDCRVLEVEVNMKNGIISQVDAQIINNYLKEVYGFTGGWIMLKGLKTPAAISKHLKEKMGVEFSAQQIAGLL